METTTRSGRNTPRASKSVSKTIVYDGNHNQVMNPSADVVAAVEQEEWTTQKKVVNHKTRQTETRVARQIVMEDGKVIADSGPQVTSRTNEDVKTEETESSNKKGNGDSKKNPSLADGYIRVPGSTNVINEKTEVKRTSKSNRNENLQYHDEGLKELTGFEVHKKAICSPNELITLREDIDSGPVRGKLIHYSKSGKTVNDTEETKELKKRNATDGSTSVEVTKTYNHEEIDDSELPRKALAGIPIPENYAETNRTAKYYSNYEPHDEDEVRQGLNCQRRAVTNTEKYHTESMSKCSADAENNNNLVAKRWVDYDFSDNASSNDSTSISDRSDGDGDLIRRVRTKAGGNVINIEMENTRRGSPGSVRSVGSSPRIFDNHRYKEGSASRTSHTVLNTEEPSVLDLVSKYHEDNGGNTTNIRINTPTHRTSTSSPSPATTSPPLQKEETREYYFGLDQNSGRHKLVEKKRSERIVEGSTNSRATSKRGDHHHHHSSRDSSPGTPSRTIGTGGSSNLGGGRFYFGSENDPSYHKTVQKERIRERNSSGNSGPIRIGINSPTDDPRPGVLYHKFRQTSQVSN